MTTTTQLQLTDDGSLFLVLPDGRGATRLIPLPEGQAEPLLRRILRAQRRNPKVGVEGPTTYSFALHVAKHQGAPHPLCPHCKDEQEMVQEFETLGKVRKIPLGVTSAQKIVSDAKAEDLGL